jgi:hypothetical protein
MILNIFHNNLIIHAMAVTSRVQEIMYSGLDFEMDSPAVIVGTSSGNWF